MVFCSLLFVFREIAKKSSKLFDIIWVLGTKNKMLKHPVAE